ncbi:hypothetical protein Mro03_18660 [Microbispora rosea subsp. rosea]|nr:hypothetical protein Mro03_18660 [Microbispora rosea subsp. rosea]
MSELRVLNHQSADSIEIGDHLAQVALHGLGPTRPGALTACRLVPGGADLRIAIEEEGLDVRRYVIVLAHADSLPDDGSRPMGRTFGMPRQRRWVSFVSVENLGDRDGWLVSTGGSGEARWRTLAA